MLSSVQNQERKKSKMGVTSSEAEKMFWRTPELVDSLLPFLNGDSTLILAKASSHLLLADAFLS